MRLKRMILFLALTGFIFSSGAALAADSEIVHKFKNAYYSKNTEAAHQVISVNRAFIPQELKALLDIALIPKVPAGLRESNFFIATAMAEEYKNTTGDIAILRMVKSRIFNSRLMQPMRPQPSDGFYVVETISTDAVINAFIPDNIIVPKGSIVRWVNKDTTEHLLASMPVIGLGGIFSSPIEPGKSWEFKFDTPGVYYYICFIHKVMYGKVTVEEQSAPVSGNAKGQ